VYTLLLFCKSRTLGRDAVCRANNCQPSSTTGHRQTGHHQTEHTHSRTPRHTQLSAGWPARWWSCHTSTCLRHTGIYCDSVCSQHRAHHIDSRWMAGPAQGSFLRVTGAHDPQPTAVILSLAGPTSNNDDADTPLKRMQGRTSGAM
jgi:hypothetical protein